MNDPQTEARVRGAVARATGGDTAGAPVRRLAGHASMRSYWRVGAPPDSHVVMVLPPDARPEEVTKGGAPAGEPVRRRAAVPRRPRRPRPAHPRVRGGRGAHGPRGPRRRDARDAAPRRRRAAEPLYERADRPARAPARRAPRPRRDGLVAFSRALRPRPLPLGARPLPRVAASRPGRARRSPPAEREVVDREFDADRRARSTPSRRGFTHRDYQSRNLMVLPGGEQVVIDFQDALLGPRQYDLVALLRDSYVELEPGLRRGDAAALPRPARRRGRAAPRVRPVPRDCSTSSPSSGS